MEEITRRPEVTHFHDVSAPYAEEYDRDTPDGYSFRVRREKVLALLPDGTNKRILDLASGPGVMIRDLRAKNYHVTCVDAAPGMIEIAKRVAGSDPNVRCEVGDAYSLRFEAASFDVLTAMGLIEYLDDEDKFVSEAHRVLMSRGLAIITVPNVWAPWRIWNRVLRFLRSIVKPGIQKKLLHREYTARRLCSLLEKRSFTVETVSYYNVKLVPYPLDKLLPSFTAHFSHALEWIAHTPLKWMATGFIVAARKRQ